MEFVDKIRRFFKVVWTMNNPIYTALRVFVAIPLSVWLLVFGAPRLVINVSGDAEALGYMWALGVSTVLIVFGVSAILAVWIAVSILVEQYRTQLDLVLDIESFNRTRSEINEALADASPDMVGGVDSGVIFNLREPVRFNQSWEADPPIEEPENPINEADYANWTEEAEQPPPPSTRRLRFVEDTFPPPAHDGDGDEDMDLPY